MPDTAEPVPIAKGVKTVYLLPGMANRHGLIAGATGTGRPPRYAYLLKISAGWGSVWKLVGVKDIVALKNG